MSARKLKEETEFFYAYLRQNGLKKTYQKDLILETFLNTEGHLSVEDIYALIKKRDRKVGVVTVFRTLKSLVACGIAREITLGDGLTRFEHHYRHPFHHHIICTECHRIMEFVCPELERIQGEILRKYNFQPVDHQFQSYGLCEDCRERRTPVKRPQHDTDKIFARDAVRMALEVAAHFLEFYRSAERRNQDPEGKRVWACMAEEEERQIAGLIDRLDEIIRQEKDLESAPVFLHLEPRRLESLLPDLADYERDGEFRMDARASLSLAQTLGRASAEFFRAFAEQFGDTQGKRIMLAFAGWEESHVDAVRQALEQNRGGPGKAEAGRQ